MMIGSMDIVGSQWEPRPILDEAGLVVPEENIGDMGFRVGTKNTKEDVDYVPPFDPGVDEDTNLPKREQSIVPALREPREASTRRPRGRCSTRKRTTRAISRSTSTCTATPPSKTGRVFFVRLGRDSLNYYEYSLEVRPGWVQDRGSGDNLLTIPFTSFTDLKVGDYATMDTVVAWGDTNAVRGESFKRVGWPSLSRIRQAHGGSQERDAAAIGHHRGGLARRHPSLGGPEETSAGPSERRVEAKFADFLDVDFDVRHVDGEFHSLKQQRGSGQDNVTYNLTSTMNADRFVSALGVATPISVTWKRSVSRPKFSSGSDIVLDEQAERDREDRDARQERGGVALEEAAVAGLLDPPSGRRAVSASVARGAREALPDEGRHVKDSQRQGLLQVFSGEAGSPRVQEHGAVPQADQPEIQRGRPPDPLAELRHLRHRHEDPALRQPRQEAERGRRDRLPVPGEPAERPTAWRSSGTSSRSTGPSTISTRELRRSAATRTP